MVRGSKPVNTPKAQPEKAGAPVAKVPVVEIPASVSVKQLADLLSVDAIDVIKRLMRLGIMANINQFVNFEAAAAVVASFGFAPKAKPQTGRQTSSAIKEKRNQQLQQAKESGALKPRPPVVTVMGHVDHGKTKLLDAIRQTNVVLTEAGGITQHIGAYQVEVNGQKITFLDTPGHAAFTAMRARGAQATDIAVLVVAADDGVMAQTLEAIAHARAAGVPIVVAMNKIDKPEANVERVKQQLADAGLIIEEWGGDTVCVPVSAKEKKGISDLLENILLVAELEELKADPNRPAEGVVLEAKLDRSKGPVATVLVQNGTLRVGDTAIAGEVWGNVRAMYNDAGKQVRRAGPSSPVGVLGLAGVPQDGDIFMVVASEQQAKNLIERRRAEAQEKAAAARALTLSNVFEQMSAGKVKELNIILKADVQGSLEPIRTSLERLSSDEVKVKIIHSASGNVTESDVMLAMASKGVIISFSTEIEPGARRLAGLHGVSIRNYDIIYKLTEDVAKALKGMLEPTKVEVIEGRAEVRAVFSVGKKEKAAGTYVTEGRITRGSLVRVYRQNKVIATTTVSSLKRFKEDVREVAAGYECGIGLQGFEQYEVGDILEFYRIEEAG